MVFPGGSAIKNLPAMQEPQETRVQSLGREDPLEESVATPFSILARKISWTEEPGGLQSMRLRRVRHNEVSMHCLGAWSKITKSSWKTSMFSANGRSILTFEGILFGRYNFGRESLELERGCSGGGNRFQ